jgi:hypothetical protein
MVYYREDGVVPVAGRELGDQVHGHDLEWECIGWCGDAVEGYFCPFCEVLALLAFGASSYVLISSASGTARGEVFDGPTNWLGSRDPMTPVRYTRGSPTGLDD